MIKVVDLRKGAGSDICENLLARRGSEPEDVTEKVKEIVEEVRKHGDKALLEYTGRFDGVYLKEWQLKVSEEEIELAYENTESRLIEVIRRAKKNIENYHLRQKENSWFCTEEDGILLGQIARPLKTVGIYVPGGTAPLPSSVLMNAVPAKVAGVERIIMATPPGKDGKVNPYVLVAAYEAGVDDIYKAGGAQAIAAMAFGTETIPRVDKITGPGNIYVAAAKRMVYGFCDIDMIAGPSEIMVVADETANAKFVAADLLSQAEHDVMASSILVTTSERIAEHVREEIEKQVRSLKRKDIIESSINSYGIILIVSCIDEALELVNRIAPEHLELCVKEPFSVLNGVRNAGAVFLGNYSSEPLGDYYAGSNHVLPTSGTARFSSPLGVGDFMKKSSVISYSEKALRTAKDDIIRFAEAEGLTAHANAIRVRFE